MYFFFLVLKLKKKRLPTPPTTIPQPFASGTRETGGPFKLKLNFKLHLEVEFYAKNLLTGFYVMECSSTQNHSLHRYGRILLAHHREIILKIN